MFSNTPKKWASDDPIYKPTYKDMNYLVGYAQLRYSQNKEIFTIIIYTRINKYDISLNFIEHQLLYNFGDVEQSSEIFIISKDNDTYPNGLNISIRLANKITNDTFAKLELEEVYFTLREKGQKGSKILLKKVIF